MKRKDSFQKTFNATYNKKINYNWKEKDRKNSVLIGGQEKLRFSLQEINSNDPSGKTQLDNWLLCVKVPRQTTGMKNLS